MLKLCLLFYDKNALFKYESECDLQKQLHVFASTTNYGICVSIWPEQRFLFFQKVRGPGKLFV